MLLLDTSGVMATLNDRHPLHRVACAAVAAANGRLIMSPIVLAELDYFLRRFRLKARRALLGDVVAGSYRLEPFGRQDLETAVAVIDQYKDLNVDLADASIVVLAHRYQTRDVLTLDERDFRVLPAPGGSFRILPADA